MAEPFPNQFRKRKPSGLMRENGSDDEGQGEAKAKVPRFETKEQSKERFARENHSEIERRRRNKMNAYINELSDMVPTCNNLIRKPDKLTILKMAVSYMKSLRGSPPPPDSNYKPSFLSDQELKHLVLEAADGFLFVVSCVSGTVIYVSDSVTPVLNQSQADWIDETFYDLIHPEDIDKMKDQLAVETTSETRVVDLKTGNIRKDDTASAPNRMGVGSRRNFVVRIKCGTYEEENQDLDARLMEIRKRCKEKRISYKDEPYAVVHCTGYIRDLNESASANGDEATSVAPAVPNGDEVDPSNTCLVAIGRLQPTSMPTSKDLVEVMPSTEFITRQTLDGRFSFVDQRVTDILGYRPVDLLGKTCYDFYLPEDAEYMAENYEQVLKLKGQPLSIRYHFKPLKGDPILLRSSCYSFQNPYTDEAEYIVCTNTIVKTKDHPKASTDIPMAATNSPEDKSTIQKKDIDVTSVIQERPGMFPYPYRVHPGGHPKDSSGNHTNQNILESELRDGPKRKNPRSSATSSSIQQKDMRGPSTDFVNQMANDTFMSSVYGNSNAPQASGLLANMARKHQQEDNGIFQPSNDWSNHVSPQFAYQGQQQGGSSMNNMGMSPPEFDNERRGSVSSQQSLDDRHSVSIDGRHSVSSQENQSNIQGQLKSQRTDNLAAYQAMNSEYQSRMMIPEYMQQSAGRNTAIFPHHPNIQQGVPPQQNTPQVPPQRRYNPTLTPSEYYY